MKKIIIILILLSSFSVFSQHQEAYCGFDIDLKRIDTKFPDLKKRREEIDLKLRNIDKYSYLNKIGATTSWNGLYTGQIYEIPVVVHVIESQAVENANLKVTDQEIEGWIERTNRMYATTYGNGFYIEGAGSDGGNVIPFKLVLAKRTPTCMPTTGILRYNGSTLSGYDTYGVNTPNSSVGGPGDNQIVNFAPHWPESSYFNIYLVIGFDGQQQQQYGLMGYARFPEVSDMLYHSFMKVSATRNLHDVTLAHELGHAFGLYHTFQGVSYTNQASCPVNNNCATDGDKVCDTSPSRSMYGINPVPDNISIDPCTGQNYDGTQYNIMNYSNVYRKFTKGQEERAVIRMNELRPKLLSSLGGKDPSVPIPSPSVMNSQCNPTGIANPSNNDEGGPTRVVLGSIDNKTSGYSSIDSPVYYEDYSNQTCLVLPLYTDISSTSSNTLKITFDDKRFYDGDKLRTKVWIDYNNNGIFEAPEVVVNNVIPTTTTGEITTTYNIIPPIGAIQNTYIRMRVAVDASTYDSVDFPDFDACSQLQYGQMEDYAVRIVGGTLNTSETTGKPDSKIIYVKAENRLKLIGNKNEVFGDYQIYDLSGKLIQKGNTKANEIQIEKELPKGTFIIKYADANKSKKFLNN